VIGVALVVPMPPSPGRVALLWQGREGCTRIGLLNGFDARSTMDALRDGFDEGAIPCRRADTRFICPSDLRLDLVLDLSDEVWSAAGWPNQPGGWVGLTVIDNVVTMSFPSAEPIFVPVEFDGEALVRYLRRIAQIARPVEAVQPDIVKRAGRPLEWDWRAAQFALCAFMHEEGKFATIAEMAAWLGQYFEDRKGKQPAESSLRDYGREVWLAYWPNGTEN